METKGRPFSINFKWTSPEIKLTPEDKITIEMVRDAMNEYIRPRFEDHKGSKIDNYTWNGVVSYVQQQLETAHEPIVNAWELNRMRGTSNSQSFLMMDKQFQDSSPILREKMADIVEEITLATFEKEALNITNLYQALEDILREIDEKEWIYHGGHWQYADEDE